MFVSESSINFMGTKLQILSPEGRIWEGQLDPSATVDTLKRLAFQYFYPTDTISSSDHFRLIYPAQCKTLAENHSLHEEQLKENDKLMFIRRRAATPSEDTKKEIDLKPPTVAEIKAATKDLPTPIKNRNPQTLSSGSGANTIFGHHEDSILESNVDFQLELRKILVSLVSVMATLLKDNADAELICQQMKGRLKRRLGVSRKPIESSTFEYPAIQEIIGTPIGIVNAMSEARKREFRPSVKAVEALREMGFEDGQIIQALRSTKNSKDDALNLIMSGKLGSVEDGEVGLDKTGHLFTALVSSPTIRLGLTNPKILLAFLNILDGSSPAAANVWLNDTDTAPVLSTIFKIYHAEKHAAPEILI